MAGDRSTPVSVEQNGERCAAETRSAAEIERGIKCHVRPRGPHRLQHKFRPFIAKAGAQSGIESQRIAVEQDLYIAVRHRRLCRAEPRQAAGWRHGDPADRRPWPARKPESHRRSRPAVLADGRAGTRRRHRPGLSSTVWVKSRWRRRGSPLASISRAHSKRRSMMTSPEVRKIASMAWPSSRPSRPSTYLATIAPRRYPGSHTVRLSAASPAASISIRRGRSTRP